MATMAIASPHLILHRFIFRRPNSPPFSALASQAHQSFSYLKATSFFNSFRFSTCSLPPSPPAPLCALSQQLADDVASLENVSEGETATVAAASESWRELNLGVSKTPAPSLSVKEKKELASFARGLGKKLKSQQVGKSGVTGTVVMAVHETLEANELVKLKIHGTCPGELEDVVKQLEETTGSVGVGKIGRTVILYRPSPTKLQAEEKKKQAQRDFLKRQQAQRDFLKRRAISKQSSQSKTPASVPGREERRSGRGRRGSSKFQ